MVATKVDRDGAGGTARDADARAVDAGRCRLAARLQGAVADEEPGLVVGEETHPASPSGEPIVTSIAFEHANLHLLDAGGGPQGSGTLMERLGDLGFRVSEPTVGRFLRTLDRRGLTTRVSNKGR